ncbi:MAG: hypothetical protein JO234_00220 [Hyphomicrobiales bacterium]|nr:hypothetical protein [Hyphomicrobiales bacterium]
MISETDLEAAAEAGVLDEPTKTKLILFLREREQARGAERPQAPKFDAVHVLYYAGALIVIGAMGLFTTTAFSALGGWALTVTGVLYAIGFVALGARLWSRPETRTPGGLAIAIAVSMAPLAIYGLEDALGLWALAERPGPYHDYYPLMNAGWVPMEVGTLIAAAVALRVFPFPFILMVASIAAWFLSMDLGLLLVHGRSLPWSDEWEFRLHLSLAFGLAMMAIAWAIDLKWGRLGDFGFWLHLFGGLTFWGALTSGSGDQFSQALYCLINVVLVAFALFLNRRIYAVLGALGVVIYLGDLARYTFNNDLAFTFALSAIGLAVILAGVALQSRLPAISAYLDAAMPASLRALRPARASTP